MSDATMTFAAQESRPSDRYLPIQIALHWAVVLMIFAQWLTSSAIHRTHNPLIPASHLDHLQHTLHNYVGIALGFIVAARILVKFVHPVSAPISQPYWQTLAASATHWGLYLSLLGQVAAGFTASYLWSGAGRIHVLLWNVTLALIAIHLLAGLFHLFKRDGVISRMLPLPR